MKATTLVFFLVFFKITFSQQLLQQYYSMQSHTRHYPWAQRREGEGGGGREGEGGGGGGGGEGAGYIDERFIFTSAMSSDPKLTYILVCFTIT